MLNYTRKSLYILLLFGVLLMTLAGCTKGSNSAEIKQKLQQALEMQAQMTSYNYTGNLEMNLGAYVSKPNEPLTAAFLALLKDSRIEWKGTTDQVKGQMEAQLSLLSKGSTEPIIIPILLKEQQLYFQIPFINLHPDEYYFIDMTNQKQAFSAQSLIAALGHELIEDLEASNFSLAPNKDAEELNVASIVIKITETNKSAITSALQAGWAEMMKSIQNAPAVPNPQFELQAPGEIAFTINEEGMIDQFSLNLQVTVASQNDSNSVATHHFQLTQSLSHINQQVNFTQEIPTKTRSIDEILNFMK